ncbi:MAG: hypothetical protein JXA42_27075, partial [Anaerolineales bacterium]|nr:hypothetical protein [Anaerolineales bacterium]
EQYAEKTAETWRRGLARDWQSPERIARLKKAADFRIYTPGSQAGLPISVVQALAPPSGLTWEEDAEALTERIESAVSALLALIGMEVDPVRSREHILLTNIIQDAWQDGQALDMADLIRSVQKPPITQLGVFDLEAFFPAKDRMELAMALNAIIASPSFASWLEGETMEPAEFFWAPDGRPRVSIFSVAHLDDSQRLFFITLLLEQLVAWMRSQSGSANLRALVYFDELFGFLPPYPKNPPTKRPLLTLLKQARAVGLGLVLCTQNPVDLDYKALSNAGIWFVGRLQTEQDKARLLDGLMTVRSAGAPLDRGRLEDLIASVPGRVFVLNNIHQPGPQLMKTRWAMSFLRGPLTRDQIKTLMAPIKGQAELASSPAPGQPQAAVVASKPAFCTQCGGAIPDQARFCAQCGAPVPVVETLVVREERTFKEELQAAAAPVQTDVGGYSSEHPIMPASVPQYFMPLEGRTAGKFLVYDPVILAKAVVSVIDQRSNTDFREDYLLALEPPEEGHTAHWEAAKKLKYESDALAPVPAEGAKFGPVPGALNTGPKLTALKTSLSDHLYTNTRVDLFQNIKLKLYSRVGEDRDDFEKRVRDAAAEEMEKEVDKLKDRFEDKIDRVEEKLRRKKHDLSEAEAEHTGRKREEALSAAESVFGFLTKRRAGRALSQASTKRRMTERSKLRIQEFEDHIKEFEQEMKDLQRDMQDEIQDIRDSWADIAQDIQEYQLKPRRADVKVTFVALGWQPDWRS